MSLVVFSLSAKAKYSIVCVPSSKCSDVYTLFENGDESALQKTTIRSLGLDKSINYLKVYFSKDGNVQVYVEKKPIVRELTFTGPKDLDLEQVQKVSQLQDGVYYNQSEFFEARKRVEYWLSDRGFLNPTVNFEVKKVARGDVEVVTLINYERKLLLEKVVFPEIKNILLGELFIPIRKLENKPYSKINFKLALDKLSNELKSEGYLDAKVRLEERRTNGAISAHILLTLGERYQFSFFGNRVITQENLRLLIKNAIEDGTVILREADLKDVVRKAYVDKGIYNSEIKLYRRDGKTVEGGKVSTFFFNIVEGEKVKLKKLSFKGNLALDIEELKRVYYSNSSVLASRDFLDEKFLENFSTVLKNFYLRSGYVFVDVSKPRLVFSENRKEAEVTYSIKERQQSILSEIKLVGVPEKFKADILKKMINKVGNPVNVVELESDLGRALNTLRESGFFYASITNLNDDDVVLYESNYTKSILNLKFKTGKRTVLENVVLSGNKVTKNKVILREVKMRRGDIITPEKIKGIRDRLNGLGLFGKIQVLPLVTNKLTNDEVNLTNLIIQVQEKKFGRGEIAPGFRTDIGAKLSFTLSRTNLMGLNDSGTLKLQLNRRFSLSQFDARRAAERNQKIEGLVSLNYSFPYLLDFANFSGNFSVQRRRFFSFDADIFRISPQLTKQINSYLGVSLRYQYERIRQFDATELRDRATFEIGGITPGITLDFRDSPVSPRSGAYLGLNWEFANPYFGSQKDGDIEINFSKVISRNRFYLPVGSKNFVLAFSVAAGMQENYADALAGTNEDGSDRTRGYIPSIKVFRLDGFDVVRGYADNEINRLSTGEDIITRRIQGRAFFANFKFEPRYYVDDTFVVGPFFDAGRLFVDTFRPTDLRTSAGLTFKFLTPVGTLDFDYGVKLRRERFPGGNRETFGRFQLSIGYF